MSTQDDRRRDDARPTVDPHGWEAAEATARNIDPLTWVPYCLLDRCGDPYVDEGYIVPDPWTCDNAWRPPRAYPIGPHDQYGGAYDEHSGTFVAFVRGNEKDAWIKVDTPATGVVELEGWA